jgi:hypothetical protein
MYIYTNRKISRSEELMPSYPIGGNDPESRYHDPGEIRPLSESDALAFSPEHGESSNVMVFGLFPLLIILIALAVLTPGSMVAHHEAMVTGAGDVQLSITVQNTNILMEKTATVCCVVTTEQGNTFYQSRTVTLDPYERSALVIDVDIPESIALESYTYKVTLI